MREALPNSKKALKVFNKPSSVLLTKSRRSARTAARSAHLLFFGANEQIRVDRGLAVHAPAHSDGLGAAPQGHRGPAYVLRDHAVAGRQGLDDREVGRVGPAGNPQRIDPKAARGPGVLGAARVAGAHVALEVLRGVARDDHGHLGPSGNRQRVGRDRAGVGVDK